MDDPCKPFHNDDGSQCDENIEQYHILMLKLLRVSAPLREIFFKLRPKAAKSKTDKAYFCLSRLSISSLMAFTISSWVMALRQLSFP